PQKFQSLVEQVKNLQINSEERLNRVIDLVFEKALDEPNFSVPYANMCKQLAMFEVPMSSNESEKVNFRKLLLLKCQKEFEKDKGEDIRKAEQRKKIEEATTEEEKTKLREEMAEEEKRSKRRSLGNIRFIGELYNLNMLTAPIMYDCLRRLLNSNDEDSLECLCKLLITIGKELDATSTTKGSQLDDYFRTMDSIVKKREVSLRVVFMLQDVIDLRMRKWIPRRDENIPKTIDQIHEEAQREQVQEKLMRDVPLPKRDDRQDRRGGGKNRGGGGYDDGWNTVPSKKQHPDYNKSMDFNKVKQISTKMTEQDSIQLGPSARMSSWAKGSSGGGKMASQEPEGRSSGATNRWSLAADAAAPSSSSSSRAAPSRRWASARRPRSPGRGTRPWRPSRTWRQPTPAPPPDPRPPRPSSTHRPLRPRRRPRRKRPLLWLPLPVRGRPGPGNPVDLVLRGSPTMDEDTLRTRTEALVDQFLCNSDFQDAVQNVVELASPSNVDVVVSTSINHILDRSPEARSLVGQLLKELLKKKLLSLDLFTKGLHSVLEYGEDMELDIPKVWEYAAELMAPLFQDHWLTLQYLRDAAQPLRAQGRAGRLAACVLALLAKTLGEAAVAQLWRTAGLQWKDFLKPGEDVEAFAAANVSTLGIPRGPSQTSTCEVLSLVVWKPPGLPMIQWCLCACVQSNLGEAYARQPHFIRALITVIAENAITTLADGNAELKDELVKGYMDLLQKYLDHREELELQALYALQALVNRLQHP
ncbi:eukaryotic translation initiation factor 4 gamma, putative, partial [Ixodes scapularis]